VGGGLAFAAFLALTSLRPATDAFAVGVVVASLLALRALEPRAARVLPFPVASGEERDRSGRVAVALSVGLGLVLVTVFWPVLAKDATSSYRFLMSASRQGDEGLYKLILTRMLEEGTIDPYPEQACFNYGHLHVLVSVAPLLPLRGLVSDLPSVAFLASRLENFIALVAIAGLLGHWVARRAGGLAGVALAVILVSRPGVIERASLAQSPDLLLSLAVILSVMRAGEAVEVPASRSFVRAFAWAGAAFGIKYAGFFLLPLLGVGLLVAWRHRAGEWPRPLRAAQTFALLGGAFLLGVLACSPFHFLYPKPVALIFLKARSEYGVGRLDPMKNLSALSEGSLLDTLVLPVAALALLLVAARLVVRLRRGEPPLDSTVVAAAWATLWMGYVAFGMGNNVGGHLLLPALPFLFVPFAAVVQAPRAVRTRAARAAWSLVALVAIAGAALLPGRHGDEPRTRLEGLRKLFVAARAPTTLWPGMSSLARWAETRGVPPETRFVCDDSRFYLPERWRTFVRDYGPVFPRGVGLFLGFPEVLVVNRSFAGKWLLGVPGFHRSREIADFYRALAADEARPYKREATLGSYDVYVLPWLGARELLDHGATVRGDLEPTSVRALAYTNERRYRAYRGRRSGGLPEAVELTLPRPGRADWLVLLWGSRENMHGWYRDETFAPRFRLEAHDGRSWKVVHEVAGHRPDSFGGCVAKLHDQALATRYRFVVVEWHGPRPVSLERLSLLEAP
jgi:hypothetical protein